MTKKQKKINREFKEVWRRIDTPARDYYISNLGNVGLANFNLEGEITRMRILKRVYQGSLFPKVNLVYTCPDTGASCVKVKQINCLVARYFIGKVSRTRNWVKHKDGDLENCKVDNLLICTKSDFRREHESSYQIPMSDKVKGVRKLTDEQILEIRRTSRAYTCADLGKKYGVTKMTISKIRRNEIWKHLTPKDN